MTSSSSRRRSSGSSRRTSNRKRRTTIDEEFYDSIGNVHGERIARVDDDYCETDYETDNDGQDSNQRFALHQQSTRTTERDPEHSADGSMSRSGNRNRSRNRSRNISRNISRSTSSTLRNSPNDRDSDSDCDCDCDNNVDRNGSSSSSRIPRRWIYDRVDGTVIDRHDPSSECPRPPCDICLLSPLLTVCPWLLEENPLCVAIGWWGFFGGNRVHKGGETDEENGSNTSTTHSTTHSTIHGTTCTTRPKEEGSSTGSSIRLRTWVLTHALVLNACGFLVTLLSTAALSDSFLTQASFGRTELEDPKRDYLPVRLFLGLLSMAIDNPNLAANATPTTSNLYDNDTTTTAAAATTPNDDYTATTATTEVVVVAFRDFCTTPGMEQFLVSPEDCGACAAASPWIVGSLLVALVACVPTLALGVLRLYPNYDTNCPKAAACLWSLLGLVASAEVLYWYHGVCLASLFQGGNDVVYDGYDFDAGGDGDEERSVSKTERRMVAFTFFDWSTGEGQLLFLVGFALRMVEFWIQCCVATPAIARSKRAQWDYEEASCSLVRSHQHHHHHEASASTTDER